MNLFGQLLPPVWLRFNSASKSASDPSPRNGIRRFGPYDQNLFSPGQIKCGVIYPNDFTASKDVLVNGFLRGEGNNFPGFTPWFKARLGFDPQAEKRVPANAREFRQAADDLTTRNCDLVFVIVGRRDEEAYRICKSILLNNGIPCQFVTAAKLQDSSQRSWILGDIALATYAKVGGTPWVVADSGSGRELVMGVSRAQDAMKKYIVGFVTLFNQEGDFLLLHSKSPVVNWEDYEKGLGEMVIEAYQAYESSFGTPESLVLHFHKRPGQKELDAVNQALRHLGQVLPYALIHLNEFSSFRLFDTAHSSYVPQAGLQVSLSRRRALLLLDGRENDKRNRMGIPNVWDISMDKRSTMPLEEFPRLVVQIHRFAKVNWRGFNAKSTPVTINYSKLICDQVLEIGLDSWNGIVSSGRLREKAWFL